MTTKPDQQTLLNELIDLARTLDRTPTQDEFLEVSSRGRWTISALFGSYTTFVQAANLDPVRKAKKVNNAVFTVDIEKHLGSYEKRELTHTPKIEPYPNVAIISDIHWPFENPKVVKAFIEYVEREQPEYVIINGDAWDMYSHGKFPRSHNVFTPKDEQQLSRQRNEEFWAKIKAVAPKAICVQMLGNHDIRPMKRVLETYPEAEDWIKEKLKTLFTFDGVKTVFDPREELHLNSQIIVFHGYRTKLGDHRDYTLFSTCNGHSHVGGVVFRKVRGMILFELNSGFAGDPEAKGLTYTPQRITNWTPGFAIINKYGPAFVPVV